MKSALRLLTLFALLAAPGAAFATNMADVVKAQVILGKVLEITRKYPAVPAGSIPAPTPLKNTRGHYLLPYTEQGTLTEWATKALRVQVGAAVGAQVGAEAGKQVASHVPFGGLASGFMKKKGKEMGAIAALGGMKYIKQTSSLSFDDLDNYAVYLHVTYGADPNHAQALAAAMAVYPELEGRYQAAIQQAYQRAQPRQPS